MPQFVPVKDDETPSSERSKNKNKMPAVDRGWEQGNVGWGVLGAFGSAGKDEAAQGAVHSAHSESSKMIKNDKGLWVKVKQSAAESSSSSATISGKGRGRGGIPVFGGSSTTVSSGSSRKPVFDSTDYISHSQRRKMEEEVARDQYAQQEEHRRAEATSKLESSRPRDMSRDHDRRHVRDRDRDRDRDRRRSRSRDRERQRRRDRSRDRDHSRERGKERKGSRRDRSRSRSKSRSHSRSRRSRRGGEKYTRERHRDRSPSRGESRDRGRHHSRNRDNNRGRKRVSSQEPSGYHTKTSMRSNSTSSASQQSEEEPPMMFKFNAIQIVNHFLEVFAMPQSTKRILSIGELFTSDAKMSSLKNPSKVYLDGAEKISNSFLLAEPTNATLSKRIFFDAAPLSSSTENTEADSSSSITFCLDFHRAGCSPGLGDVSKPTVLLYRCNAQHITAIWGMVDKENIADSSEDLTLEGMKTGRVEAWNLCLKQVMVDMPHVVNEEEAELMSGSGSNRIHFHNYDKIDVWG
mmetsp:Transcript_919/g.1597  ORF Transcript_919/g.1597 Transcript_919/m.1597 type:complete len:520 (-) Transcript_919:36-1595(-)